MEPILLWIKENWGYYVPGIFIIIGWIVSFRWLYNLNRKAAALSERLSKLEGYQRGREQGIEERDD